MLFHRTSSLAEWEEKYGYSRALRAGELIFVTGTAPMTTDGKVFAPGDAEAQALRCYEIIEEALTELHASKLRIARTRMFVTDISKMDEFGKAHRTFFGDHRPCLTMVEVKALALPDMMIEIEAEAVCPARPGFEHR